VSSENDAYSWPGRVAHAELLAVTAHARAAQSGGVLSALRAGSSRKTGGMLEQLGKDDAELPERVGSALGLTPAQHETLQLLVRGLTVSGTFVLCRTSERDRDRQGGSQRRQSWWGNVSLLPARRRPLPGHRNDACSSAQPY
jgi:hypothetical protein